MAVEILHNSELAARYATALFELAEETGAVAAVSRDLSELDTLLHENSDFRRLVKAPVFSAEQQRQGMDAVLRRMEAAPLTRRFVLTLATKRRLFVLPEILSAFGRLLGRAKGEIEVEVTAARRLSEAESAELKRMLTKRLGRAARLTTRAEPELLGGLVVKVGSRMIDSSLRTKLEGLRSAMRGHPK